MAMAWPAGAVQTRRPSLASYQTLSHWTDALVLLLPPCPRLNDLAEENSVLCFTLSCLEKYTSVVFFSFF